MPDTIIPATAEEPPPAAAAGPWYLMWGLLLGGVLLVCCAAPLGVELVTQQDLASGGVHWSQDDARQAADTLRLLGLMAFGAGLVERLVLSRRSEPDEQTVSGPPS